ncbi:MAG: hypothetical protein AAFY65_15135, partial [Pseudomonadota bacterium]
MIPTLLGIMVINFSLIQFVPGGPVEQVLAQLEGEGDAFANIAGGGDGAAVDQVGGNDSGYLGARGLPPEFIEELERQFGFDKPPLERFLNMMWDYMRFDFGESYFRSISVVDLVIEKMPVSITLGLWSTILAYLISIPLGIRKAVRDGSTFDTWTSGVVIVAYAIPGFLFAILLLVVFAGGSYFQAFPLRGLTSDEFDSYAFLGRVGLYLPWMALALAAAVIGGACAARYGRPTPDDSLGGAIGGPGAVSALTAQTSRFTSAQAMVMGGLLAIVPAAAVTVPLAGNTIGSGAQHLWVVLTPAVFGILSAWYMLRRADKDAAWGTVSQATLRIALRAIPGVLLGLLTLGVLSTAGAIKNLPTGAEVNAETLTLFGQVGDYFWHITLPVLESSISSFSGLIILTKNSLLDDIRQQY